MAARGTSPADGDADISIQSLLEFASAAQPPAFPDDSGPVNVNYWPWSESHHHHRRRRTSDRSAAHENALDHFRGILNGELRSVAPVLAKCHTVWVIGDLCPPGNTLLVGDVLGQFAVAVSDYTKGEQKPLVIELRAKPALGAVAGDAERPEAAARYVPTSRTSGDDAMAQISKALGSAADR